MESDCKTIHSRKRIRFRAILVELKTNSLHFDFESTHPLCFPLKNLRLSLARPGPADVSEGIGFDTAGSGRSAIDFVGVRRGVFGGLLSQPSLACGCR